MSSARLIVGTIGNIVSLVLFLLPVGTFYQIHVNEAVEGVRPYPYLSTALNCLWWMFYGLPFVSTNNIPVLIINSIGLVIELIYICIYLFYANLDRRRHVRFIILGGILFTAVMVTITFAEFKDLKNRDVFVGIICDIVNVIMYASPFCGMGGDTANNLQNMPFLSSLAGLANGICWTIYALIPLDWCMLLSNALGAFIAVCQLVCYGYLHFHGEPLEAPLVTNESETEIETEIETAV